MDSLTLLSKETKTWVTDYLEGIIKRVKIFQGFLKLIFKFLLKLKALTYVSSLMM